MERTHPREFQTAIPHLFQQQGRLSGADHCVQHLHGHSQKPADSMEEIMETAKCYIKGEDSNEEKKARDTEE